MSPPKKKRVSKRSNAPAKPHSKVAGGSSKQRLQRVLAAAGFGSRRQCEEMIETGRVDVNGEIVTKLGSTVTAEDKVKVDGVLLKRQKLVYYAVHKPTGVVTTNSDPQGRPRVVDLVPNSERVYAVGRLDRSSEGLILLTNDGDLAQQLTHPKFGVRKIYRVTVAGRVDGETMKQMRKGIYIAEGRTSVEGARIFKARSKATELEIVLREGKNREIRRILARLGHKVLQLRRIAVGPLRLGDLPVGAYRIVSREEVKKLRNASEAEAESDRERPGRRAGGKGRKQARSAKRGVPTASAAPARSSARPPRKPTISIDSSARGGAIIGGDEESDAPPKNKGRAAKKKHSRRTDGQASAEQTSTRRPRTKKSAGKRSRAGGANSVSSTRSRTAKKKRPAGKSARGSATQSGGRKRGSVGSSASRPAGKRRPPSRRGRKGN